MKKNLFISCLLICSILCSCASSAQNQVTKNKKDVESFSKIASSGGIDVYFTQGNSHTVEIETDDETLNKIEVAVKNGTLELKRKDGERFRNNVQIKAYVTAKNIQALAISGGADFIAGNMNCDRNFDIAASGGSDINIDLLKVDECKIAISGGADCDIKQIQAKIVRIAASGGSDSTVTLDNVANVNIAARVGADVKVNG
ncbi:MAG: DUF2807 domain-containing protein, partial [Prevotella sp.]|nr:DUF2807 domain-containing protein [Prevotella sp.]